MTTEKKEYGKPLPPVDKWSAPFWEGIKKHQPVARKCKSCGHIHYPYSAVCTNCLSYEHEWVKLSGQGTVYSTAIYYQLWRPSFKDDIPYSTVLVDLDEGIHLPGNMVGINNEDIDVGMRVEMVFDDVTPEATIYRFKPMQPLQFAPHPLGRRYRYEDRPRPNPVAEPPRSP